MMDWHCNWLWDVVVLVCLFACLFVCLVGWLVVLEVNMYSSTVSAYSCIGSRPWAVAQQYRECNSVSEQKLQLSQQGWQHNLHQHWTLHGSWAVTLDTDPGELRATTQHNRNRTAAATTAIHNRQRSWSPTLGEPQRHTHTKNDRQHATSKHIGRSIWPTGIHTQT